MYTLCFYKERSVFRGKCQQVVYEMFIVWIQRSFLIEKNDISSYIWLRAFIQMVKCSLLDEKIVYQSFYGALITFSYFLLRGKVLCFAHVGKLLVRCLLSKAFRIAWPKNYISGPIWHKAFIKMVKYSFPDERIVYRFFLNISIISKRLHSW